MMIGLLSKMQQQVDDQANRTVNLDERFYLDALVAVLGKAREHTAHFFPSLATNAKEGIIHSFIVNYDLIHIDDERSVSFMTGLKTNEVLTPGAIARFYKEKARCRLGNMRSPLAGVKTGENLADAITAAPVLARLCQENVRRSPRDTQSPHAIILYKKTLYHYHFNYPNPHELTPIVIDWTDTSEAGKNSQIAYRNLKEKLTSLPKDHIYRAEQERAWMATLLAVPQDKTWRHIDLRLAIEFLEKWVPFVEKSAQDWRDTKKGMLWLAIIAALLTGVLYLLGVFFPVAKIVVLVQFAMWPILIAGVAGLGIAAYCYAQEKFYQKMVADFTQIDYAKTYPGTTSAQPARSFSVKKSLGTFFTDHQEILERALPPLPAPVI